MSISIIKKLFNKMWIHNKDVLWEMTSHIHTFEIFMLLSLNIYSFS